jgi:hypothetical protein
VADRFAVSVANFAKKGKANMDAVVRKIVLDISTRVVMRSPVGDPSHWSNPAPKGYTGGHFRANWQYAAGLVPQGVLPTIDKSGRVSIERVRKGLEALAGHAYGKVHWLTNNLPYAMRLETGWSRQAPQGMVGLVVREFQSVVRKAADSVRKS